MHDGVGVGGDTMTKPRTYPRYNASLTDLGQERRGVGSVVLGVRGRGRVLDLLPGLR